MILKTLSPSIRSRVQDDRSASPREAEVPLERVRVVIAKRDRLAIEQIAAAVESVVAAAEIVTCQTAASAWEILRMGPAHLGVFGLSLPDMDGLDLLARVTAARRVFRLLVISGRTDERARHWLRPGRIDGLLNPEREGSAGLVDAIRTVAAGGVWFRPEAGAALASSPRLDQMFSPHELRVFAVIGDGCDDRRAGAMLGVSPHTVHSHRRIIMHKLGVQTRTELMIQALRRGVVRITAERVLRPGFEADMPAGGDTRGASLRVA